MKEGRFTAYLVQNGAVEHMTAVDLWREQPGNDAKEGGETYGDEPMEHFYRRFMRTVDGLPVTVHRMSTDDAAALVPDGSLDFVFIDADHSEESVKRDIANWAPKVRKGGLLSGHDIDQAQVQRAVIASIGNYDTGPNKVWLKWT